MSRRPSPTLLEDTIQVLVRHFGADRVRAALSKISDDLEESSQNEARSDSRRPNQPATPTIPHLLEELHKVDVVKFRLLADFYQKLREKRVLPEAQDIRHYAQLIGLKEIEGNSRRDLIPRLMRFLMEQTAESLQGDLQRAEGISEEVRQRGFSVLTDKLLGEKD